MAPPRHNVDGRDLHCMKAELNMCTEELLKFVEELSPLGARKMEKERITSDLVHLMTDDELIDYLPVRGDRLRLRQHVRNGEQQGKRKNKLLKILHQKVGERRSKKDYSSSEEEDEKMRRQYGNRNAVKGVRLIEIGWIDNVRQRPMQVRSRTGGGTRKVSMRKDAKSTDILDQAKNLFFPNGESQKGAISDFNFELWDFSERLVLDHVTLQQMYDNTKMPILRFYLATCSKAVVVDTAPGPASETDNINLQNYRDEISQTTTPNAVITDILSAAIDISGIVSDGNLGESELPDLGPELNIDPDMVLQVTTIDHPKVRVHRGHVLIDMIRAFKTIDPKKDIISFEMIMPNGSVELAEDGGGVTRDTLTEFWQEFYEQCTLGTSEKVPFLRHDFGDEEWGAVAKIIVFGWISQGYFPLQMSLPFMQLCVFGHPSADLTEAFYKFVPEQESACFQMASVNFANVDEDELMDILDGHEVRQQPSQSNITRLVQEIAHKELIQTPMFVADCWNSLLKYIGITESQLSFLYEELNPTPRGICKSLFFPENMNQDEKTVCNHLKRFIRELNEHNLRKFVRFCTGSDLLITKKISVAFVNTSGLARRPVAHTCTSLLELSRNYDSFPQFRAELMGILESNIWVMDII